jgi:1,4-dihydroxy-2-naphthoate octaprenyltransferase
MTAGLAWKLIRPKTLLAGIAPVMLGGALAYGDGAQYSGAFSFSLAGVTLFCVPCLQAASNLANDYFDYVQGHDTAGRTGPLRLLAAGRVSKREMLRMLAAVLLFAFFSGSYLVIEGGPVIFFAGFSAILASVFYTAPPMRLGASGLGEASAFLYFGPAACWGTYFLQRGTVSLEVLILGFVPGFFSLALLTVNNYRDREEDRKTGKNTWVVRLGPGFGRFLYVFSMCSALLIPAGLYLFTRTLPPDGAAGTQTPTALLTAAVPAGAGIGLTAAMVPVFVKLLRTAPGVWLNRLLGRTVFFEVLFVGVLSVTVVLW